jgi:hypothetical protein
VALHEAFTENEESELEGLKLMNEAFCENLTPKWSLFGRKTGMLAKLFLRPGNSFTIQMARKSLSVRQMRVTKKS